MMDISKIITQKLNEQHEILEMWLKKHKANPNRDVLIVRNDDREFTKLYILVPANYTIPRNEYGGYDMQYLQKVFPSLKIEHT